MRQIYKQAEVGLKSAYLIINRGEAVSILASPNEYKELCDMLELKEVKGVPIGLKVLPKAREDEFLKRL